MARSSLRKNIADDLFRYSGNKSLKSLISTYFETPGFYIGHFGGIVISAKAKIGKNCNISQNVTIGYSSRGKNQGWPTIMENVYIGPGAVVIGNIIVGENAAVGANAFVNADVPDNAVVEGVLAKTISFKGSEGYILNKVK